MNGINTILWFVALPIRALKSHIAQGPKKSNAAPACNYSGVQL